MFGYICVLCCLSACYSYVFSHITTRHEHSIIHSLTSPLFVDLSPYSLPGFRVNLSACCLAYSSHFHFFNSISISDSLVLGAHSMFLSYHHTRIHGRTLVHGLCVSYIAFKRYHLDGMPHKRHVLTIMMWVAWHLEIDFLLNLPCWNRLWW